MLLALPLVAVIWATPALAAVSFPGPRSISYDTNNQPYIKASPAAGKDTIDYWGKYLADPLLARLSHPFAQ